MQTLSHYTKVVGRELIQQIEMLKTHKNYIWYLSKMPDIPEKLLDRLERAEICVEMALEHLVHVVNDIEGKKNNDN